ncbi:MAG TPA: hypothetical protein VFC46_15845 [Humisphaera sp.]|nr:hypothetical protein [Humisphaera sp.]
MDSVIRFEFTLTFGDFLRYQYFLQSKQRRLLLPFAILSFLCFMLMPWIPVSGHSSLRQKYRDYFVLFLPWLIFMVVPLIIRFSAKKRWNAAPNLQEPRVYEFSDAGISVTGRSFAGSTLWNLIPRAEMAGPMILLIGTQREAHIVPLDAVGDSEKVESFKSLIRRKVPDCKNLR